MTRYGTDNIMKRESDIVKNDRLVFKSPRGEKKGSSSTVAIAVKTLCAETGDPHIQCVHHR